MKASVSICIIVKNDPFLEKCLQSLRDYVEEIVIVDTGSTDTTPEVAKKYADIFEVFTACNDPQTGLIEDFAMARQRSFDLATKPWVMWCDSDDTIVGMENLLKIINEYEKSNSTSDAISYLFPYEYAYDVNGQCTCVHYRERLFSNKKYFKWVNPVHEVVIVDGTTNVSMVTREDLIFKHQRQYVAKAMEPGRNLRILKKYFDKVGESDARQMYYLGLEYCNTGLIEEAIKYLSRYIEISGWDDERAMASLKLVDIYHSMGQYEIGLKWAFKTIEIMEKWGEGYFATARMFYHLAIKGGPTEYRNWEKCIYFAQTGLKLPPTKTLLFVNPLDRECEIYKYLNMAFNKIGDVGSALESVKVGMQKQPNDPNFVNNKKLYEDFLARREIASASIVLKNNNTINQEAVEMIAAIMNNQPIKNYVLNNSNQELEVEEIEEEAAVPALENDNPLDIIFFAGDGVEVWTPKTVKKTGIGGSELMLLEQAKRLAHLGHKVRVYNSCGVAGAGSYNGVEYHQTQEYHNLECDVLVVSRRADMLGDQYNIQAKLKLLWVHDVFALAGTNESLLKADKILALSEWHKQNLISFHNLHPEHIIVTRNGIDLSRFDKKIDRNKFKCVNSSSPDRSWPILLDVWPEIKKQVPQAELHLYYGFKNWIFAAQHDSKQMDLIRFLQQKIKDMGSMGVVFHDRINQKKIAEEFLSSGVWVYPTWFSETSCISAMEMQAAGVRMVTSNIAALKETAGGRAILLDGEWTSPEYRQKFIDNVIGSLNNDDNTDRQQLQDYAKENFGLDELAKDWENMFHQLINEIKINPIIPYYPTTQYRQNMIFNDDKKLLKKATIIHTKSIPKISVIVPTNRTGGLDILFESLKKQTFQDFELILVDALFNRRRDIVKEKSKLYNFTIKHIEPINNTFPISNYCKSINSGLVAAAGNLSYFTCDYAYLDKDVLLTHNKFHLNTPINYMLMLPVNECQFNKNKLSNKFPKERQYGTKGLDKQYQLLIVPEEDYVKAHNTWSDHYAEDIKNGLLDGVLWSIFEEPLTDEIKIETLISSIVLDTKLANYSKEEATIILQDLCCLKNDSFKTEFLLNANGMEEELDGSHGFQDTELARRLAKLYNGQFYAINKCPVSVINTRYYLEPRKIINGYNNIKIIDKKYIYQEPLKDNTITKFKERKQYEI